MANTISTQVILDSTRNTIIKITIAGDGSGDESNTIIFNASDYIGGNTSNKIWRIEYSLNNFDADLLWDADTNVPIITLSKNYEQDVCYEFVGGLVNNAGTGKTGDILMSTDGMVGTPTTGHIVLYIKKKS